MVGILMWKNKYRLFAKHHTLSSQCRIFSSRSKSCEIRIYRFQSFILFIVVIVISILLKTAFSQTSIHSQSLVKILWRSDKDKITFKAIEKQRYGLRETVSKHLKSKNWATQCFLSSQQSSFRFFFFLTKNILNKCFGTNVMPHIVNTRFQKEP